MAFKYHFHKFKDLFTCFTVDSFETTIVTDLHNDEVHIHVNRDVDGTLALCFTCRLLMRLNESAEVRTVSHQDGVEIHANILPDSIEKIVL